MLNITDFSYQTYNSDFDKCPTDYQNYYDKENCNVHQLKPSERLPFQAKSSNMNPLCERIEDNSNQSTKDSSPEYDQSSRLNEIFNALNNANQKIIKECQHANILQSRCSYCRDCGIFLPMSGSFVYREQMYEEKITTNPDEVYEIMLKNQIKNRFYHPDAPHVEFRKTITDWIFQVSQDLKISPDTTCAIISYVDTILCKVEVSKENLQLVILTCLILATKFSEMDDKVPPFREAYNLCQGAYSIELFKKAECFVLETLEWNLKVISPYQYIHHYLSKGCLFSTDQTAFSQVNDDVLRYLRRYAECFANLSMDSYEFNQYLSHVVACAAIAGTRKLIGVSPVWNPELEELTGTSWDIIEPCFNKLYSCFEIKFPEFMDLAKVIAEKNECQSPQETQNIQIDEEESSMQIEDKESPVRVETSKNFAEEKESGKKESLPAKQKQQKRKGASRLSKANKENKSKNNENNSMNIESSNEFFEDSSNLNSNIKRNLIY